MMPTSTFFNLPPSKRGKLFQAAVEEFARQPYGEVSLSQVIKAAGIPRGSFYQYFSDKTDLFRYVLRCYDQQLEETILECLELCGGRLMEFPLVFFDRVLFYIQQRKDEFTQFLGVLRQNMGMDAGELLSLPNIVQKVIDRADWRGLEHMEGDERLALMDLLFTATGRALMPVFCEKLSKEESRRRLALKIAIIRRGAEHKEEPLC